MSCSARITHSEQTIFFPTRRDGLRPEQKALGKRPPMPDCGSERLPRFEPPMMKFTMSEELAAAVPVVGPVRNLIAALQQKRSSADMVAALKGFERPQRGRALEREIKSCIEDLSGQLEAGLNREALATALAIFFADADYAIGKLRRGGVLRASKYRFKGVLIGNIARAALDARSHLVAREKRFEYLRSVLSLVSLAPSACVLNDRIVKILSTRENVALKTVFAVLNSRFYHYGAADPSASSLRLARYSAEDLSDAASLLVTVYREMFEIHDHCCNRIDDEGVAGASPVYERLFLAAIRLVRFKEAEVMIDGLPFQARKERGAVRVSSIDPDVEKSIRLGYVQGQNQLAVRVEQLKDERPALYMRDMIAKGFEKGAFDRMIQLVERPVNRFRLFLPTAPQVFEMFRSDQLFRDEYESLLVIDADTFGRIDPKVDVAPHVTMMDLLKVQRYFNFISCLYQRKIESIEDEADRAYLTFTSTIPVMPHGQLLEQFQLIFDDEVKSRAIIELLRIDYASGHIDLQYTPLFDLGSYYVIAPHVLATSNLVRNVTVAKRLREFALGPSDPMVAAVLEVFSSAGFKVQSDKEVKVAGKDVELDIVAWRDDALFILECKNAYHPCSPHETRNSYDHIQTARRQLDIRRTLFADPVNQLALFRELGWDVEPTARFHTGVVTANRVFHGARFGGHPVRQAHELINALRTGIIDDGGDGIRFWRDETFAADDLITYLGDESLAAKQISAMEPYPIEIDLGGRRLVFESFALNQAKLRDALLSSYGTAQT